MSNGLGWMYSFHDAIFVFDNIGKHIYVISGADVVQVPLGVSLVIFSSKSPWIISLGVNI